MLLLKQCDVGRRVLWFVAIAFAAVVFAFCPATARADSGPLAVGSAHELSVADADELSGVLEAEGFGSSLVAMYRLYNPYTGEHFYTADKNERNYLASLGWHYEGVGWMAPSDGDEVYRLYNPYAGDHHYTLSSEERDSLQAAEWRYEGVCWHSLPQSFVARKPLFRQFNPNAWAGAHNFTLSKAEDDELAKSGWVQEGVCWYGLTVSANYSDDMETWWPRISGDYWFDTRIETVLREHPTLEDCYNYVADFTYRKGNEFYGGDHFLPDYITKDYCNEMLDAGSGNCYRFSSLFCWLARGLGYQANVVSGWVPSYYGGQAPHGWVEVYVDGETYVCDPDMYNAIRDRNWFMVTYENAPASYGFW